VRTVHSTFRENLSIIQKLKWRETDTKSTVISEAYLFPVEESTLKFMMVNEGCTVVLFCDKQANCFQLGLTACFISRVR
jgi:hypothetical protein